MGMNKIFLDRRTLMLKYEQGLARLVEYVSGADCILACDAMSEEVIDCILSGAEESEISKLVEKWT